MKGLKNMKELSLIHRLLFGLISLTFILAVSACGGGDDDGFVPDDDDLKTKQTNPGQPATPITLEGSGDDVLEFSTQQDGPVYFDLQHTGTGVFFVDILNLEAEQLQSLLINSGDVDVRRVANLDAGSYLLDIEAGGDWSIIITPPSQGTPDVGTDIPSPVVKQLSLRSSAQQMDSSGTVPVTLTALARDANNTVIEGASVQFSSSDDDVAIEIIHATTNASGIAEAKIINLNQNTDRFVTVRATAGEQTAITRIQVTDETFDPPAQIFFSGTKEGTETFSVRENGTIFLEIQQQGNGILNASIRDSNGNIVHTLSIASGTDDLYWAQFLEAGDYTIEISGSAEWDAALTLPQPAKETDSSVYSVTLLSTTPQLPSSADSPITLTAFIRDANNVLMKDVPVQFSADSETAIQVIRDITDETGTAQATLNTLDNRANRTVTASATADGRVGNTQVQISGTTLSIAGSSSSMILGDTLTLTITLRDSANRRVPNEELAVSSSRDNSIDNPSPTTNINGQAIVNVTAQQGGQDTITVSGAGTTSEFTFNVSTDTLAFIKPDTDAEVELGTPQEIRVLWESAGTPVNGQTVRFTATRGNFNPASGEVLTDADGEATIEIDSTTAGPSIITANANNGPEATSEILFVAAEAEKMMLQASPAVLGTNPDNQDAEQSEIIAIIRDPAGNLVKNKLIRFNLTDVTGGSLSPAAAITDAFGRAATTYTAGNSPSQQDGIVIRAWVDDKPSVEEEVKLTTAEKSLFITLGTGNVMEKRDSVRYAKPYGVLVTDVSGGPVPNAEVTVEIWPTQYFKGFWQKPSPTLPWEQVTTAGPCANEDVNRDGILDPGEDSNNNDLLDPGNIVTLSMRELTTDSSGFADFDVVYFQQFAQWVDVELRARATVEGSESTETIYFKLPIFAEDVDPDSSNPPGNPSPFGQSATCADDS
ncbi:Ig-like domain-containing protein [Ectothiorhodospira marina]|nr:Ig-like domain-containing protein [Ectothiorhodospira marina]